MAIADEKEMVLKSVIQREKRYEKKRPFLWRPLSREEFCEKYWMGGEAPYQYHTMRIEDGRDEREQLIINNIREVRNKIQWETKYSAEKRRELEAQIDELADEAARTRRQIKILSTICAAQALAIISCLIR